MSKDHLCGARDCGSSYLVYLAVLKFNDGDISFLKIFQDLDITPGVFTGKGAQDCDKPNQTVGQKVQREGENKKKNIETPQKEL